jgi:hypothetical protein
MKFNRMKTRHLSNRPESNKKLTTIPHPFPFFCLAPLFSHSENIPKSEPPEYDRGPKLRHSKDGEVDAIQIRPRRWQLAKTQKTQRLPTSLATSKPSVPFSRLVS